MKTGIQIKHNESLDSFIIFENYNPNDEGYGLYNAYSSDQNEDIVLGWMSRVGLIEYRDKFLERMINRYK